MDQDALFCNEEMLGSPWSGENAEVLDPNVGQTSGDDNLGMLTNFPPRDDAALQTVLEREQSLMPDAVYANALQAEGDIAAARSSSVNWLLKVRNAYAFSPMTAALAVSYLDRYLSKHLPRPSKAWVVQLLSVACISLAAKMEEVIVPCLPDLQVEGLQHIFEAKTIQRMELVVLKALGWRMSGVTPFEYVDDLLYRLDIARQTKVSILARVTELLLGTLPEVDFLCFRPSVVAVAAISCALEETVPLKAEMYQRTLLTALPMNQTTLQRCYSLMEELVVDPVCPGISLSQVFGSSKSPPSPLTVIEMSQTGDVGTGELPRNVGWPAIGEQMRPTFNSNPKKRKMEADLDWDSNRDARGRRTPDIRSHSLWEQF